ncbi:hypothetical protein EIP91_002793 [Steccherinum ochraceum]|uniref:Uncharacterized protein n=1 Tax=Steccherinum ochraceum TaxID=92696 RepID=A0A4V2MW86_9APHY|nr:hypothetical protein EIP91_002793 [Steccherinum ochraceum]
MTAPGPSTWHLKSDGPTVPVVFLNGITQGEARADGEDSSTRHGPPREAKRRVGDDATPSGSREATIESPSHLPVPREASAKEFATPPRDHCSNASDGRWLKVLSILFQDYWNTSSAIVVRHSMGRTRKGYLESSRRPTCSKIVGTLHSSASPTNRYALNEPAPQLALGFPHGCSRILGTGPSFHPSPPVAPSLELCAPPLHWISGTWHPLTLIKRIEG